MVDEVAHEDHPAEGPAEVEVLDARFDLFRALDELEHLRVEVDRDDAPPERDEGMRDPARSSAELQDLRVVGYLAVDELGLVRGLEQPNQIDGRARISHTASVTDAEQATSGGHFLRVTSRWCSDSRIGPPGKRFCRPARAVRSLLPHCRPTTSRASVF